MTEKTTVEILRGAKALLETKGWTHGCYEIDGCLCSVSALNVARGKRPLAYICDDDPAARALAAAMGVAFREGLEWDIIGWNDTAGRTPDEVLAKFDEAIAAEEAKVAA